ncbi:MAG: carbohydrate-binding protein, partial [Ruminococcus sp.]|nr:carbohydrate-binding protein [Ruminococcus sp.]
RNNIYYLVYAAFYKSDGGESLGYSTAPTPTGPWTYGGQVMTTYNCFTNHPGVIDYKGKSYLFYHDASLKGGGAFDRSVCIDEFSYNPDGSIPTITPTKEGPQQLELLNPFERVEAETICFSDGIKTETCSNGGMNIANIENDDYVKIKGVDFGDGADKFTASVASNTDGGKIELHIDSVKGPLIGLCNVSGTGGWQNWEEVSCDVVADGEHDLYLVFKGDSGYLLNVDWWKFDGSGNTAVPLPEGYIMQNTFEKNVEKWQGRGGAKVSVSSDSAYNGDKSLLVSGRTASWHGAVYTLDSRFKTGETYSFSTNVMYDSSIYADRFYLTFQYDDEDDVVHYEKVASAVPAKGEWVQLANTEFTIPENAKNMYIYVETEKSDRDFYVDDFVAAVSGTKIEGANGKQLTFGDLNSDGNIDVFDVILARQGVVGELADEYLAAADVDRDEEYGINDLVLISRYAIGQIENFSDSELVDF